ncbi:MAG: tRNA (adenosine(37)-N6)-dimethylallyltransferase MiaA [Gemmataceae bacterium]|nr:tRNA (adenosine(37)-N6)-dimethylallyltransferase MiaA [Gemmataceae bacterium]
MPPSAFDHALILTGPTASGKTALALDLAERLGGEVVAMDSMTVYRGMDIGTAKPTPDERARVPHHLIDELDPWEGATVAWWLARAEQVCADIVRRGRRPIVVGGTPFYLKALLHGLFPGPPGDPGLRRRLETEAEREGPAALHARLAAVDPPTAARLHPNDIRRVVRALEVHGLTGRPISAWQTTWDTPAFASANAPGSGPARIPAVVLELPRGVLYDRINQRVGAMLAAGWRDEVRRLRDLPRPPSREAAQAVGYRELLDELDGRGPGPDATAGLIRTRTRQFSKRQLTWFRHLPSLVPVAADGPDPAATVVRAWESVENGRMRN